METDTAEGGDRFYRVTDVLIEAGASIAYRTKSRLSFKSGTSA